MRRILVPVLAAVLLASAIHASAQIQAPAVVSSGALTRQLSVEEAVRLALENNLGIQFARISPQLQDLTLAVTRANWAPTFTTTFQQASTDSPVTSFLSGGQEKVQDTPLGKHGGHPEAHEDAAGATPSAGTTRARRRPTCSPTFRRRSARRSRSAFSSRCRATTASTSSASSCWSTRPIATSRTSPCSRRCPPRCDRCATPTGNWPMRWRRSGCRSSRSNWRRSRCETPRRASTSARHLPSTSLKPSPRSPPGRKPSSSRRLRSMKPRTRCARSSSIPRCRTSGRCGYCRPTRRPSRPPT